MAVGADDEYRDGLGVRRLQSRHHAVAGERGGSPMYPTTSARRWWMARSSACRTLAARGHCVALAKELPERECAAGESLYEQRPDVRIVLGATHGTELVGPLRLSRKTGAEIDSAC